MSNYRLTFEIAGVWDYARTINHGDGTIDELKAKAEEMQPGESNSKSMLNWRSDGEGFIAECYYLSGKLDGTWRIVPV